MSGSSDPVKCHFGVFQACGSGRVPSHSFGGMVERTKRRLLLESHENHSASNELSGNSLLSNAERIHDAQASGLK